MRKLILAVSFSFTCIIALAQKNYQPATIVTNNGESQTGEIDYKNWNHNPSTILFRSNASAEPRKYGVNDLQSFTVADDKYIRAVIEITARKDNNHHLSYGGDSVHVRTETVFLLTVVSGPKSLYQYTNNVENFYIPKGDGYEFLTYRRYKVIQKVLVPEVYYAPSNQEYVATNKAYIKQLREYLPDCSQVKDDVKYELRGLKQVFASYYKCLNKNPEYIKKSEKEKIEIGVIAGATNTTFNVNSGRNEMIERAGFSSSTDAAAGVSLDLVFPRNRGRVSLNNELMYTSYKTAGSYRVTSSSILFDDYTYNFEYSYLKLNTMLRYKFFIDKTIIYINGGFSNGLALSEVNTLTKDHNFNGTKTT